MALGLERLRRWWERRYVIGPKIRLIQRLEISDDSADLDALREFLEEHEDDHPDNARYTVNIASCWYTLGEDARSTNWANRTLALVPLHPRPLEILIHIAFRLKNYQEALRLNELIEPDDMHFLLHREWLDRRLRCYLELGLSVELCNAKLDQLLEYLETPLMVGSTEIWWRCHFITEWLVGNRESSELAEPIGRKFVAELKRINADKYSETIEKLAAFD